MRISHDPASDSVFVHLSDAAGISQKEIAEGVILDYDADGKLRGIEMACSSVNIDVDSVEFVRYPLGSATLRVAETGSDPRAEFAQTDGQRTASDQPEPAEVSS